MTKLNFQQMSRKELKKYILAHPTDDEAIYELVKNRRSPNVKVFSNEMPDEEVEAILKATIANAEQKTSN